MIAGYIIGGMVLGALMLEIGHMLFETPETKATVAETPDTDPRDDVEFKLTTEPDPYNEHAVVELTYTNGDVETVEMTRVDFNHLGYSGDCVYTTSHREIYMDHVRSRRVLQEPDDSRTRTYDSLDSFVEAYNEALQSDDRQLVGYTVDD